MKRRTILAGALAFATATHAQDGIVFDRSPELQAERQQFIQELIAQGIFYKVEMPGHLPHLWVGPAFYELPFDDKQALVSIVFVYYFVQSEQHDLVRVFDSRTGKQIGTYAEVYGGLHLD